MIHDQDNSLSKISGLLSALKENTLTPTGTFDSAAADSFLTTTLNQDSPVKIPKTLQAVFDEIPGSGKDRQAGAVRLVRVLLDSAQGYEKAHGCPVPADVLHQALHSAYSTTRAGLRGIYDSAAANSLMSDPQGLQSNRAIVAIMTAFAEAIPFAHYLPADISSNKATLAIMNHLAGKTYGAYAQNALMDGVLSGDCYISAARTHQCAIAAGVCTGKLTTIQSNPVTCDPAAPGIKTLRGRSIVYVNGMVAAKEVNSSGSGTSVVAGSTTIAGTAYSFSGSINSDTGVISLTTSPQIPVTAEVIVEGFVDYERQPELVPSIISAVQTYELLASPWRVNTFQTIDSRTQMANELGLDPYSESVIAIQNQFANERHYNVLRKAKRIAANKTTDYDFNWSARSSQLNRYAIWKDCAALLGSISQQMAIDTMSHGVSHLYVGKSIMSEFRALPPDMFEQSGVWERPGIFRVGRFLSQYDVYYEPGRILTETATTAQILCVGRAPEVTRNPFVLGDAVAPIIQPLAVGGDLNTGAGFYARNFTEVNPHPPSSMGCSLLNVINLH